ELLLTDIVMPEMDGIELARRAAELDPDIKIMFITGFATVALNSDSNAPKHAKVLSKPIHLRELVNEVQKLLAASADEARSGITHLSHGAGSYRRNEHFVGSSEGRVGMAVQVDDIFCHRLRILRSRLSAGENAGGPRRHAPCFVFQCCATHRPAFN